MNENDFNYILFKKMRKKSFAKQEFAKKIGVTPNTIYNWEAGRFIPNRVNISKIESSFGVKKHFFENQNIEDNNNACHMTIDNETPLLQQAWEVEVFSFLSTVALFENFVPNINAFSKEDRDTIIVTMTAFKIALLEALTRAK